MLYRRITAKDIKKDSPEFQHDIEQLFSRPADLSGGIGGFGVSDVEDIQIQESKDDKDDKYVTALGSFNAIFDLDAKKTQKEIESEVKAMIDAKLLVHVQRKRRTTSTPSEADQKKVAAHIFALREFYRLFNLAPPYIQDAMNIPSFKKALIKAWAAGRPIPPDIDELPPLLAKTRNASSMRTILSQFFVGNDSLEKTFLEEKPVLDTDDGSLTRHLRGESNLKIFLDTVNHFDDDAAQLKKAIQDGSKNPEFKRDLVEHFAVPDCRLPDQKALQESLVRATTNDDIRAVFKGKLGIKKETLDLKENNLTQIRGEAAAASFLDSTPPAMRRALTTVKDKVRTYFGDMSKPVPNIKTMQKAIAEAKDRGKIQEIFHTHIPAIAPSDITMDHATEVRAEAVNACLAESVTHETAPELRKILDNHSSKLTTHFKSTDNKLPDLKQLQKNLVEAKDEKAVKTLFQTEFGIPDLGGPDAIAFAVRGEAVNAHIKALAATPEAKETPLLQKIMQDSRFDKSISKFFSDPNNEAPTIRELQKTLAEATTSEELEDFFVYGLGIPEISPEERRAIHRDALFRMTISTAPEPLKKILEQLAVHSADVINKHFETSPAPTLDDLQKELATATTSNGLRQVFERRLGIPMATLIGTESSPGPLFDKDVLGKLHATAIDAQPYTIMMTTDDPILDNAPQLRTMLRHPSIKRDILAFTQTPKPKEEKESKRSPKHDDDGGYDYPKLPTSLELCSALAKANSPGKVKELLKTQLGVTEDALTAAEIDERALRGEAAVVHVQHALAPSHAPALLNGVLKNVAFTNEIKKHFDDLVLSVPTLDELQRAIGEERTAEGIRTVLHQKLGIQVDTQKTKEGGLGANLDGEGFHAVSARPPTNLISELYGEAWQANLPVLVMRDHKDSTTKEIPNRSGTRLKTVLEKIAKYDEARDEIKTHLSNVDNSPSLMRIQEHIAKTNGSVDAIKQAISRDIGLTPTHYVAIDDKEALQAYGEARLCAFLVKIYHDTSIEAINVILNNVKVRDALIEHYSNPAYRPPNETKWKALYAALAKRDVADTKGMIKDIVDTFIPLADRKAGSEHVALQGAIAPLLIDEKIRRALFGAIAIENAKIDAAKDAKEFKYAGVIEGRPNERTFFSENPDEKSGFDTVVNDNAKHIRKHIETLSTAEEAKAAIHSLKALTPEASNAFRRQEESTYVGHKEEYKKAVQSSIRSILPGGIQRQKDRLFELNRIEHSRQYYNNLIENKAVAEWFNKFGVSLCPCPDLDAKDKRLTTAQLVKTAIDIFNKSMRVSPEKVNLHVGLLIEFLKSQEVFPLVPGVTAWGLPDWGGESIPAALYFGAADAPSIDDVIRSQASTNHFHQYFDERMDTSIPFPVPDPKKFDEAIAFANHTKKHNRILRDILIQNHHELNTSAPDFKKHMADLNQLDWENTNLREVNNLLSNVLKGKPTAALENADFHQIETTYRITATQLAKESNLLAEIKAYGTHVKAVGDRIETLLFQAKQKTNQPQTSQQARENIPDAKKMHDIFLPQVRDHLDKLQGYKDELDSLARLYDECVKFKFSMTDKIRSVTRTPQATEFDEKATLEHIQRTYPLNQTEAQKLVTRLKQFHKEGLLEQRDEIAKQCDNFSKLEQALGTLQEKVKDSKKLSSDEFQVPIFRAQQAVSFETDADGNVIGEMSGSRPKTADEKIQEIRGAHSVKASSGDIVIGTGTSVTAKVPGKGVVTVSTILGEAAGQQADFVSKTDAKGEQTLTVHLDKGSKNIAEALYEKMKITDSDITRNNNGQTFLETIAGDETDQRAFFDRCIAFSRTYRSTGSKDARFSESFFKNFLRDEIAKERVMRLPDRTLNLKTRGFYEFAETLAKRYKEYIKENKTFLEEVAKAAVEQQARNLENQSRSNAYARQPQTAITISHCTIPDMKALIGKASAVRGYTCNVPAENPVIAASVTASARKPNTSLRFEVKEAERIEDDSETLKRRFPTTRRGRGH